MKPRYSKPENIEEENEVPIIPCKKNKSHEWVIEAPNGPASNGKCDVCGATSEFSNYVETSAWGYDISAGQISSD
tara:strand:- start:654 stop:878 length:225 start_codon:yes stop_codon:yes gene_type:complete